MIKDTEMEFRRRQSWKRIFPTLEYGYYKQFFVNERQSNALIDAKVMAKRRMISHENAQILKQKILNTATPGTFQGGKKGSRY